MAVLRHNVNLFEKVHREFWNNCLWYNIDGNYREQKHFEEVILSYIFNIVEINPADKVASMVHSILKWYFFEKPEHRRGIYKQIRYEILPVLWKNHRTIERKKQRKLMFLDNELHGAGRVVEAHIVRTIVKPYICDLNRKWSRMTAVEKMKTVQPLLTSTTNVQAA